MKKVHSPYSYDREFDILSLSTRRDYEESAAVAYDLMANFDTKGHCMGFEFLDAAELFLPYLSPDSFPKSELEDGLTIAYDTESDILSFRNDVVASYSETVIEHCVAHLDWEGYPVGFTLEKASEYILPLLLQRTPRKAKRT